jgi:putative ABC transport system ATP-binding protein
MAESLIQISGLVKNYQTDAGPINVLKRLDISIGTGEFVAIMGPSGSGKSTFMNILGCLDGFDEGRYLLDGADTRALSKDALADLRNKVIGFVFQGFNLLPRISLIENVALPLIYANVPRSERLARAREMLEKVGLGSFVDARPNKISGGQQQRVAIARALINRPRIILADEPTGNLDTKTGNEIMTLFEELNQKEGITIVLVTHEPDIATYADRLVSFLDGRIVHDGPVVHEETGEMP